MEEGDESVLSFEGAETNPSVVPQELPTLFFETEFLSWDLELTDWSLLTGQ